jgi:DNA-directed RNA polymerase specialized sigma24 family protein
MELIQAFEDKEVRDLLLGGEADLETDFALVDTHLRKRFVKGARDRLPGLRPEDLADAWQETLKDLLKAVKSGRFDPDRELVPWLWTSYIRQAFDSVRGRESYESMVQRVRMHHPGAAVPDIFAEHAGEERQLLMARVRQAMGTLPLRQRTVLQVFVDHFPVSQDKEVLRDRVSRVTGHQETPTAVRRALEEARRKLINVLGTQQI